MPSNVPNPQLKGMLGIHNRELWLQTWKDATEIYETSINELEFSVKSWAKLSNALQVAMIVKAIFPFNIEVDFCIA